MWLFYGDGFLFWFVCDAVTLALVRNRSVAKFFDKIFQYTQCRPKVLITEYIETHMV